MKTTAARRLALLCLLPCLGFAAAQDQPPPFTGTQTLERCLDGPSCLQVAPLQTGDDVAQNEYVVLTKDVILTATIRDLAIDISSTDVDQGYAVGKPYLYRIEANYRAPGDTAATDLGVYFPNYPGYPPSFHSVEISNAMYRLFQTYSLRTYNHDLPIGTRVYVRAIYLIQ